MRKVAEAISNLHYEALEELIGSLGSKIYRDSVKDRMHGREKLGFELLNASIMLSNCALFLQKAWYISKPFMNKKM